MYESSQLYDLSTNEMLKLMFPNLRTLANVCMSLPVRTVSVERSFSKMKKMKLDPETDYLKKVLMKISPQKLIHEDLVRDDDRNME